jgi:hypothetical protein
MSLVRSRAKAVEWNEGEPGKAYDKLRFFAASKLCQFRYHEAGKGSRYIFIGDDDDWIKIRFADHENTSSQHEEPDYNFVNDGPSEDDLREIEARVTYPFSCKKVAFAKHVGLSVPKLKKLLYPECYTEICENRDYPNTFTEVVQISEALNCLDSHGIKTRIPIMQETESMETYSGY